MKNKFTNGYKESIEDGLKISSLISGKAARGNGNKEEKIATLKEVLTKVDTVLIGAGAGLSTSAGFSYSGARFEKYFFDFIDKYKIKDMYSGGFYPFPDEETLWAWWARHIYFNRYVDAPLPVYKDLFDLVKNKNYFVITTNVDHQFQKNDFDKSKLFYTQGDYGLFQSSDPKDNNTYDNEEWVYKAMEAQGFVINEKGIFDVPDTKNISMKIPSALIPKTPDGNKVVTNLRADNSFVESEGWHKASAAYGRFLKENKNGNILFLELGVGLNTPVIIKYPFWKMALDNKNSIYATINYGEAMCPIELEERCICIDGDIGEVLKKINNIRIIK